MSEETGKPQLRGMVEKIRAILTRPREAWSAIAAEDSTPLDLIRGWVLPLALVAPIAMIAGREIFDVNGFRPAQSYILGTAVAQLVNAVVCVIVLSLVADLLAPRFGGHADRKAAFKLVCYSATAWLLAGVVMLVPALSMLAFVGLYALYLFYLGAPELLGIPDDEQAIIFTMVTFLLGLIILWAVGTVTASFVGPMAGPTSTVGMMGG